MKLIVSISLIACLTVAIYPATYKGKSIDGKKYAATVTSSDGGLSSADVRFEGRIAHLYFEKWTHKVYLKNIQIEDPSSIHATDGTHTWTIILRDKLD